MLTEGDISKALSKLVNLESLQLQHNSLTGTTLLSSSGTCSTNSYHSSHPLVTSVLYVLNGFCLQGTIPKEFGQLKKLKGHFCLQYNELKGTNPFSAFGFTFNFNLEA